MLMRAETREALVNRTLRSGGWWTQRELAELAHCSINRAHVLIRRLAKAVFVTQLEIVFARHRRTEKYQPLEYRCLPRAVQVQAIG